MPSPRHPTARSHTRRPTRATRPVPLLPLSNEPPQFQWTTVGGDRARIRHRNELVWPEICFFRSGGQGEIGRHHASGPISVHDTAWPTRSGAQLTTFTTQQPAEEHSMTRALRLSPVQQYLERLHAELQPLSGGELASYIPELTRADPTGSVSHWSPSTVTSIRPAIRASRSRCSPSPRPSATGSHWKTVASNRCSRKSASSPPAKRSTPSV